MTVPSEVCPTSVALMPNLPNLPARPRASVAVALPNLPDLSGSRAYGANRQPSSHHITTYRLGRLGMLGKVRCGAGRPHPNLSPTFSGLGWDDEATTRDRAHQGVGVCGTRAVERGSSPGGTLLRAASAQNSPSFCLKFLVNFNGLRVKGFMEGLK